MENKLTKKELKQRLSEWFYYWQSQVESRDFRAYNQLNDIVEEHFHLKSLNLEEAERWVKADIEKLRAQQKPRVSREKFNTICDAMRCADILTPDSTYGDVARFVLEWANIEIEK